MLKERRSSYRFQILGCHLDFNYKGNLIRTMLHDISEDGCYIRLDSMVLPKIGDQLTIIFYTQLMVLHAFSIKAVVKHATWNSKGAKVRGFGVVWDLAGAMPRDRQILSELKEYYRELTLNKTLKRILKEYGGTSNIPLRY